MSAWRARLAVLGVFLAGFLAGAATLQLMRLRVENRIFRAPDLVAQVVVYKLDKELDLSPEQRRIVQETVLASRGRLLSLRKELAPALVAAFEEGQARIRQSLDPKQRKRYDEIIEERRRLLQEVVRSAPPAEEKK